MAPPTVAEQPEMVTLASSSVVRTVRRRSVMVPSSDAVARRVPSGLHSTALVRPEWSCAVERLASTPPWITRAPQSVQSVPRAQCEFLEPGPPSLQSPSLA